MRPFFELFALDPSSRVQHFGFRLSLSPGPVLASPTLVKDVYDPVTFEGARFCEARVWSFFREVSPPPEGSGDDGWDVYLDYVTGYNLTHRMDLFVPAARPISLNETMWHMRNHFENTYLDPSLDVGAEQDASPYRLGEGLTWDYGDNEYVSERFIGAWRCPVACSAMRPPSSQCTRGVRMIWGKSSVERVMRSFLCTDFDYRGRVRPAINPPHPPPPSHACSFLLSLAFSPQCSVTR